MPHAVLRLVPGVDTQETPALNENSGISQSQLIRFMPDRNGIGLVQKLGGWTRYFPQPMPATIRALWAWEDLNSNSRLAVGTKTTPNGAALLGVITNGTFQNITPQSSSEDIAPAAATTMGSPVVTITDNTTLGITGFDSVYIATQISIGGVVLFGLYQCGLLSNNAYTVQSTDILGNPLPAVSASTSPVLASFTTVSGSLSVTVTLPNYTYQVGATFPVLVATTVGGITLYGNYVVQSLVDANNFTIVAANVPNAAATVTMNGGNAHLIYSYGYGTIPGGIGYGAGAYGAGGYGTGNPVSPSSGNQITAKDWTLDNWGEILIACAIQAPPAPGTASLPPFQPLYQWEESATGATIITAAPPVNDGAFVAMPQRQIVTWGSTQTGIQDPLLVNWCDVNNFNQWIALPTNQAGSYRIPRGSRIVGGLQGPQQAILWTDIDAWSMQYIGPPFIYSFNEIGSGCGLISRKAAAFMNGIGYWMGPSQFFTLSSAGVQPLYCSVWDEVFQNLHPDTANLDLNKIRVAVNSLFGEITWYYPSANGDGENDSYVKYTVPLNIWDYGTLGRTAWVDQSVLGPPIGADPVTNLLYQHETSNDADLQAMQPFFQSGYFTLSEGDLKTFIDLIWPDMKWGKLSQSQTATVQISFYVADYPGDTPTVFGPYSVTQATQYFNTRLRGRLVSIRISSSDLGSFWRIGALRYRFAQDGKF